MDGCQNCGPFLGTLNIRCRIIIGIQKGTIILTTTHLPCIYPTCTLKGPSNLPEMASQKFKEELQLGDANLRRCYTPCSMAALLWFMKKQTCRTKCADLIELHRHLDSGCSKIQDLRSSSSFRQNSAAGTKL